MEVKNGLPVIKFPLWEKLKTSKIGRQLRGWEFEDKGGNQGATTTKVTHNGRVTYIKRYDSAIIGFPLFKQEELRHPNLVPYRFTDNMEYIMPDVGIPVDTWREKNGDLTISHIMQIVTFFTYLESKSLMYSDLHGYNACIKDAFLTFIDLESINRFTVDDIEFAHNHRNSYRNMLQRHNNEDYKACMMPYVGRVWFPRAYDFTNWRVDITSKKQKNEATKSEQQENEAA